MSLREEIEDIVVFGDGDDEDIEKIINKILDAAVEAMDECDFMTDDDIGIKLTATESINKLRSE